MQATLAPELLTGTEAFENPMSTGFLHQWRERFRALNYLPVVLSVVWKSSPILVCSGILLRLVAAGLPLAMLAISKIVIDSVAARAAGKPLTGNFWWWMALEVLLAASGAILGRAIWYTDTELAELFSHNLSVRIMEHASSLDIAQYEDAGFHDTLERARLQATDRAPMISTVGMLLQQVLTGASFAFGIALYSPMLLGVLVLGLIPALAGESHFAFLGYSLAQRQTETRRRLDYLRVLGASKESAKELKLFSLAPLLTGQFRELSKRLFNQNRKLWRRRLLVGSFLSAVGIAGYYGAYVYVVYTAVMGLITVGTLAMLTGAIAGANGSLQTIFSTFSNIADQTLFLKDLDRFFKVQPALVVKPDGLPVPNPIMDGFRFENVTFIYPGTDRPVLENFNFHLGPGDRIALVGENGQGKTTIIKLITRLYDPTYGRILLDGVDLREYDRDSLTRQFSVLFQDFMRYEMSAEENIGIGRLELQGPQRRPLIAHAALRSGASEVIGKLPRGMQQMLGRRFEGGVDLSGGEWQKVALARAYLRDAQIYILDEPTAALDAKAEFEVFDHFAKLTEGRMAVMISHRFSTVKMVDRIVVIKDGRIAEQGNHEELMARDGIYASLFEMQAASYR